MPVTVHVPFHIREETTVMTITCAEEEDKGRGGGERGEGS